ncbi:hypothetical protein JY651_41255 [Pyxidicoccus parkwayensis]|uniref:Lipoprotein n=1 Tax=Pyxidicoccus parkwayensis TaxID=2813578 RepID=A0ABX7NRZ4_9BACT|nr:ELWxxDGT repeat protein [Pyxidicoccus parkwaysis]QSQ21545.1 hypothetical protein JY651_41255 [Pyxidicoccus parkwaysis]
MKPTRIAWLVAFCLSACAPASDGVDETPTPPDAPDSTEPTALELQGERIPRRLAEELVRLGPPETFATIEEMVRFRGALYFFINTYGTASLWRTDGTQPGTVVVREFETTSFDGVFHSFTLVGDRLFFLGEGPGVGKELWVSDGTSEGTLLVKDITEGPEGSRLFPFKAVGNTLFFGRLRPQPGGELNTAELWRSDGTRAGTVLVKELATDFSRAFADQLTALGDLLLFTSWDETHGREVWRSDGTPEGTVLVKDLEPGFGGSLPGDFTVAGDVAYFTAEDSAHGQELWRTDGTTAGTRLVEDILPGPTSAEASIIGVFGDRLYLLTRKLPDALELRSLQLRTGRSTKRVATLPAPYLPDFEVYAYDSVVTGSKLYFTVVVVYASLRNAQLWVTDGTREGTQLLRDQRMAGFDYYPSMAVWRKHVLFNALEPDTGLELWGTSGTPRSTRLLHDVNPGADYSYPRELTSLEDRVLFFADNGGITSLWAWPAP